MSIINSSIRLGTWMEMSLWAIPKSISIIVDISRCHCHCWSPKNRPVKPVSRSSRCSGIFEISSLAAFAYRPSTFSTQFIKVKVVLFFSLLVHPSQNYSNMKISTILPHTFISTLLEAEFIFSQNQMKKGNFQVPPVLALSRFFRISSWRA